MKKLLYLIPLLALLLASCDPKEVDLGSPDGSLSTEALDKCFSFEQWSDETHATAQADGNYFTYKTTPAEPVIVYQLVDGQKNVIGSGPSGSFKIIPRRGQSNEQTFYVAKANTEDVTTVEKKATVYVPSELTAEMKLLVSDDGQKIWKWDTSWTDADGNHRSWGNGKYKGDPGEDFGNGTAGIWWGCTPEDLTGQLSHSDTGKETGEESEDAYMEFNEDGSINTYNAKGEVIRKGKFTIENYNGGKRDADNWAIGKLKITAGTILFPFEINKKKDNKDCTPTEFDILKLTTGELVLVYSSNGKDNECTWWHFKSNSDGLGNLTDYSKKAWTWDTSWVNGDGTHRSWGNGKYQGDGTKGEDFGNGTADIWWGCSPEDLTGQLSHSDKGVATGEEDSNAYMEFASDGTIKTYDKAGKVIREGKWEITYNFGKRDDANWSLGTLTTTAGSILFPFEINKKKDGKDCKPTKFDIMKLTSDELVLAYSSNGKGNECTWWHFKLKK